MSCPSSRSFAKASSLTKLYSIPSLSVGRAALVVYVGTRRTSPDRTIQSSAVPFPAPLGPDIMNSGELAFNSGPHLNLVASGPVPVPARRQNPWRHARRLRHASKTLRQSRCAADAAPALHLSRSLELTLSDAAMRY